MIGLAIVLFLGELVIAAAILYAAWLVQAPRPELTPPAAEPPVRRTRIIASETWSPEGWGPPDSEVITTEGDDFLMRKHRPLPSDEV